MVQSVASRTDIGRTEALRRSMMATMETEGKDLSFLKTPSGTGCRPVGAFETTAEEEIDSR